MKKFLARIISAVIFILTILSPLGQINVYSEEAQSLFINEVMASNQTIRDGDAEDPSEGSKGGAYSDWIEIYNASSTDVDMTGCTISDTSAAWTFPGGSVPAKGFLLIWASDKNKVAKDGQFHTNFKISSSSEVLTLKKPDGTIIDVVTTPALEKDMSFARKADGSLEFAVFSTATPGKANAGGTVLQTPVAQPVFSHQGGFYSSAFDLQLSTSEAGTKIYYTTDSSDPVPGTPGTSEYTGAISIKSRAGDANVISMYSNTSSSWRAPNGEVFKCSVVRAVAVRADGTRSRIATNSYFVDPNMGTRYALPVISLVTPVGNFFDNTTGIYAAANDDKRGSEWERPIHMEFFGNNGSLWFSHDGGVRINGGYTRNFPQKSLRLYADGGYDSKDSFDYDIFPSLKKKVSEDKITSFQRLILRNSGNDWSSTMFRDAMMQSLVSDLKLDTQAYRPAVVFLDGEYWGIYNIRERYDNIYLSSHYNLDKDRVVQIELPTGTTQTIDMAEGEEADGQSYVTDITDYLQTHSVTDQSTYEYLLTRMDMDNYINYQVSNIYFNNTDWPGNNMKLWKYKTSDGNYHPEAPYGQDGRWRWLLCDTDFGFGLYGSNAANNTLNHATATNGSTGSQNQPWSTFLLRTLLQNTTFRNEFINRIADHMNTRFTSSLVNQRIETMKADIESSMAEHIKRWQGAISSTNVWNNNVQTMKNFANQRQAYVRQHIVSKFSANGVSGTASINLNTDTTKGFIKINSIDVKTTTPGITNAAAWTGTYFKGVPVTMKAIPEAGHQFDHWEGVTGVAANSDTITFTPASDLSITAVFKAADISITEVKSLADVEAAYNTDFSKLILPASANVVLSNGTEQEVAVSWDPGSYNKSMAGTYTLEGTLAPASGISNPNSLKAHINVIVKPDASAPVIKLKGNAGMGIRLGETFIDPGATASDDTDGDITSRITVEGHVDTDTPGVYTLKYSVTDIAGNPAAELTRKVVVAALEPEAFELSKGPYSFTEWSSEAAEGTYPENMVFLQTALNDTRLEDEMTAPYCNIDGLAYKNSSRTRMNGLGSDGVAFINTGKNVDLGAAVLALNTTGKRNVKVSWTGGTVLPNVRTYAIILQYRVGKSGAFANVTSNGNVVEYVKNSVAGHSQTFSEILLPKVVEDKPYVELRWKYYLKGTETSGSRAQLRLDDISVTAENIISQPAAVLSADSSVQPGASFTVGIGLNNLEQSVYAQDITLSYDSNVFEYISAAGVNNNIQIAKEDKATAGKVRLIAANIGGVIGAGTQVLNLTFKVKAGVHDTSGTIAVTQAKLGAGPQGTVLQAALDTKSIAIGSSEEVSVDLNKDGSIDVGDLAIVAYYFGKDSTAADWSTAKIADINGDNKIDISDLAYVASRILE